MDNEKLLAGNRILYNEIQEEMRKTKAGKDIPLILASTRKTLPLLYTAIKKPCIKKR